MLNTRTILAFLVDEGVYPMKTDDMDISLTIEKLIRLIYISKYVQQDIDKETINKRITSVEVDVFDWNRNKLSKNLTIGEIPKPGIVILINKETMDKDFDSSTTAAITKLRIENAKDLIYRELLNSFLMGPEGKFEPKEFDLYDAFISYSSLDENIASELYEELKKQKIKCFLAKKDISTGLWEDEIRNAIRRSKIGLILLTPNSVNSKWVLCEAGAIWGLNKLLIPALMFINPNDLPEAISKFQGIKIETTENRKKLIKIIKDNVKTK